MINPSMRYVLLITLIAMAAGCSPNAGTPSQVAPAPASNVVTLDEAKVLAIARQAVATNDSSADRASFKATRNGSGWSVHVEFQPTYFGNDRLIKIDEYGRVTSYSRGR